MNLVITMSRRFGTGSAVIAKELSDRLKIPVYDKSYVAHELAEQHYESEADVIRKLAEHPCIILGRCASHILKDQPNVFSIYLCADREDRIRRVMILENREYEDAKNTLEYIDAERSTYYHRMTGKAWGDVNDYHMILDTSRLGIENCAGILIQYFERMNYI